MVLVATVILAGVASVLAVMAIMKRRRHVRLVDSFPGRPTAPLVGNVVQMGEVCGARLWVRRAYSQALGNKLYTRKG